MGIPSHPVQDTVSVLTQGFLSQTWYFLKSPLIYWRHPHTSMPLEVEVRCGQREGTSIAKEMFSIRLG